MFNEDDDNVHEEVAVMNNMGMPFKDEIDKEVMSDDEENENGNHSSCSLRASDLVDGLRILKRIGDYFCPGRLVDISPPDIYGIVVDKERGNKPHIFSQEEVLQEAVMEIKPTSVSELKVGDRVCVFWSSKMSYLHPGAVAGFDGDENFAIIQLDDGDSRDIHIDQIRYLPQNYPLIVPEQVSFTGLFGSRKRVSSTVMKKPKTEEGYFFGEKEINLLDSLEKEETV